MEAGKKIKIMIIDDDEFLLDMYATKFKELGFDTEVSFSGAEALEKIRGGVNPEIVLLDIVMPNMDGFEFLRTARKENLLDNSKVIVLTNLGQKEDIDKAKGFGASDYIVKAYFTPTEVIKKVNSLISR